MRFSVEELGPPQTEHNTHGPHDNPIKKREEDRRLNPAHPLKDPFDLSPSGLDPPHS